MTESEDPEAADNAKPSARASLPPWLNHFNARDLKVVLRCWVAIWAASILMFIQPSLRSIGIATFFSPLVLYLVPPAGILFVYLLGALTLLLGMCLAWAWGIVTMKAALAARPESQTRTRLQQLQETAVTQSQSSGQSVDWVTNKLVREGFMLDVRVTVVFYVMCCAFIYLAARLRAGNPKLAPGEVFGNIIIDLFLLYGPTLPSFTPELGKVLVEPGAIGIGLGIVCCLLFFPHSTSYAVLGKVQQLVLVAQKSLRWTRARLSGELTELAQLQATKAETIATFQAVQAMLGFLPLDFSRGRWSAEDVGSLRDPLRQVMVAELALLDFHIARMEHENRADAVPSDPAQNEKTGDAENEKPLPVIGRHQLRKNADVMRAWKTPELGMMRSNTREALKESTAELLQVYSESLTIITECISAVNSCRWFCRTSREQLHKLAPRAEEILGRLGVARSACVADTTERLIACHVDLFNKDGKLKPAEDLGPHAIRSLVLGMVMEERVLGCAEAAETLLTRILELLKTRTRHRIWFPAGPGYAVSWLVNGHLGALMFGSSIENHTDDPDLPRQEADSLYRRPRINQAYGKPQQPALVSRVIRHTHHWLTNPAGMYALRMVAVTIATAIPASLPATAGFFYREKGLWGVITAQICVLVYTADFTFSVFGRVAGTIVGGLLAMVSWYIGSGSGPGNPYGLAAITAVMTLILVWCRLFFPHSLTGSAVISGVTFVLVLGFSYDATHLDEYGLPGYGYAAFYKRVVTVLLGIVAALVVQMLPRPPSTSRHVRKSLANTVRTLSDHYALLLSHWNRSDSRAISNVVGEISLQVADSLLSLQGPIGMLKFEIRMDSFDQQTLRRVQELCQDINQALSRLLSLSDTLPRHLQEHLVGTVGILDNDTIGAVMAVLGVIEQVLKTGDPLPERLPTPILNRYYDSKSWTTELSIELVRNEDYRRYCVAMSSYLRLLRAVDDLVLVLKRALGESHVVDRSEGQALV